MEKNCRPVREKPRGRCHLNVRLESGRSGVRFPLAPWDFSPVESYPGMGIGRGSADFRRKRKTSAPKNKTVRSNQNVVVLHQVKNWQNWKMQGCFMQFLRLVFVKKLQLQLQGVSPPDPHRGCCPLDPHWGPSAAPRPLLFS